MSRKPSCSPLRKPQGLWLSSLLESWSLCLGPGLPLPCWEPVSATGCGASFILSDHAPGLPLVFVEVTWASVPGVEPELACPHWGPWPSRCSEKGGTKWSQEKPLFVGTTFTSTSRSWSKPVRSPGPQLLPSPSPCRLPVRLPLPLRMQVSSLDQPQSPRSLTGKATSIQWHRGPPRSGPPQLTSSCPLITYSAPPGLAAPTGQRPVAFALAVPSTWNSSPESLSPLQVLAPAPLLSKACPEPPLDCNSPHNTHLFPVFLPTLPSTLILPVITFSTSLCILLPPISLTDESRPRLPHPVCPVPDTHSKYLSNERQAWNAGSCTALPAAHGL